MLLAIDSSCDETALCLLDWAKYCQGAALPECVVAEEVSSQVKLHAAYGGVVPELAAREHIINLPLMLTELLRGAGTSYQDIDAVAVTRGPGLNGCLLVGLCFAKGLSYCQRLPLILVNHVEAHIFASLLAAARVGLSYPSIALVVSGGHTLLLQLSSWGCYQIIAQTRDDAAGEAFDKCANLIGLGYPGGPELSRLAESGEAERFVFPIGLESSACDFSFSGLKTAVLRVVQELKKNGDLDRSRNHLCAAVEKAIVAALLEKTKRALLANQAANLVLCGGVAANRRLRAELSKLCLDHSCQLLMPEKQYCTDNAAMVGALALETIKHDCEAFNRQRELIKKGATKGLNYCRLEAGALPRWPITQRS